MKYIILSIVLSTLIACSGSNSAIPVVVEEGYFAGFAIQDIPGSDMKMCTKKAQNGTVEEKGTILNNKKHGMWSTFSTDDKNTVKTIESYVNGVKNGPHLSFNDRGQVTDQVNYLNDDFDGVLIKYQFGKPKIITEYLAGEFHGPHMEFHNNGQVQKIVNFKQGKQHGLMQYFDEDGNKTLEYEYMNGEKLSGGMIEN